MRLFVTGASGFIGSATVAELTRAGHQVVGLVRSDEGAARVEAAGAESLRGSLDDPGGLRAAAAAADGAIHLAYKHGDAGGGAVESDRRAIQALGDGLRDSGRPLVVTSGTLVLPAGRVGTESDPPDPDGPAAGRLPGEAAALASVGYGVRASVVRLAPSVHDRVRRGFAGGLIEAAVSSGVAGYVGDGSQRWPAAHRLDAARLFRLAAESAPPGSILHGVGESGVTMRSIAELIGARLDLPVSAVGRDEAPDHFGWLAPFVAADFPASSAATRSLLDWEPSHPGLLADLRDGDFFDGLGGDSDPRS